MSAFTDLVIETFCELANVRIHSLSELHGQLARERRIFNRASGRQPGFGDTFDPTEMEQYRREPETYPYHLGLFRVFETLDFQPHHWRLLCQIKAIRDYWFVHECLPISEWEKCSEQFVRDRDLDNECREALLAGVSILVSGSAEGGG
jgi:hypothetical protein